MESKSYPAIELDTDKGGMKMAVYKPTYCFPFATGVDARTAKRSESDQNPAQYLSCKVDTSNKNITGYKIRVLTDNNQVVFEGKEISPISELEELGLGVETLNANLNSGVNGTFLRIPFFQNLNSVQSLSYNAIYYEADFLVDRVICSENSGARTRMENVSNWTLFDGATKMEYDWDEGEAAEQQSNMIILDGEPVQEGDLIIVSSDGSPLSGDAGKNGIWIAQKKTTYEYLDNDTPSVHITTILQKLGGSYSTVVVAKGKTFHNSCWVKDSHWVFSRREKEAGWYFFDGNTVTPQGKLSMFDIHNNNYKWDITLYQGDSYNEGVPVTDPNTGVSAPAFIIYDDVAPEWLDMTVTSGQIMGSTPERIQVGLIPGDGTSNNSYLKGDIPRGTDADPLVLQNTFMAMAPTVNKLASAPRVPIIAYDATFGHAHPLSGSVTAQDIKKNNYCAFFKHSNSLEYIEAMDVVDYATFTNVPITFGAVVRQKWYIFDANHNNSGSDRDDEIRWRENTSSLERYLIIPDSVDRHRFVDGEYVLLMGQAYSWQNGIYTCVKVAAGGVNSQQAGIDNAQNPSYTYTETKTCLVRSASYDDWGAYLGKVIFAKINGQNYESLASAGQYMLWNPLKLAAESGTSPLYFKTETPILLNPGKISKTFSYKSGFTEGSNTHPHITDWVSRVVAGVNVSVGDTILYKDGFWGVVGAVRQNSSGQDQYMLQYVVAPEYYDHRGDENAPEGSQGLQKGHYYYTFNGDQTSARIEWFLNQDGALIEVGTDTVESGSSVIDNGYHASIMKNTTSRTFISPWLNIAKTMKLQLLDNCTVKFSGQNNYTPWINIKNFNDKLYFVIHGTLSDPAPLQSFNPEDFTDISVIPWRYNLQTYFRTSDENPFYTYETPYVILYKNDQVYTDLAVTQETRRFQVLDGDTPQEFQVEIEGGGGYLPYGVSYSAPLSSIASRAVKLSAQYVQFGQSSWTNYRWVLYGKNPEDGEGEFTKLLQDTGRRYDKYIVATFYGLTNDTNFDIPYKFVLSLENEYGDIISQEVVLYVLSGTRAKTLIQSEDKFLVQYDCTTQSNLVIIDIEEGAYNLSDDATYSIYRREYGIYEPQGIRAEGQFEWAGGRIDRFIPSDGHTGVPYSDKYLYIDVFNNDFAYRYKKNSSGVWEFVPTDAAKIVIGEWEPVLVHTSVDKKVFRDFNISNGRSYQYAVYPGVYRIGETDVRNVYQSFANSAGLIWYPAENNQTGTIQGHLAPGVWETTSSISGQPVCDKWDYWSIAELVPEPLDLDVPLVRKQYRVNNKNIWLFKYSLETGSITQNISREEFETLGRFPKFGFGEKNADSGQIQVLLGSELVPCSKAKYLERPAYSRLEPLSTNEKAEMLKQWNNFVYSKNPKLLRDIKGNAWIVQVTSNSSTTQNFVYPVPSTISFEWKQSDSTQGIIIYGDYEEADETVQNNYQTRPGASLFEKMEVCCSTPACTKFDVASALIKNYAGVSGLGNYSASSQLYKFVDFPKKFEEVEDRYGNTFIKIPTMYRKIMQQDSSGQITAFRIATTKLDEGYVPYSVFVEKGEGDEERILPYIYIGKYVSPNVSYLGGCLSSKPVDLDVPNSTTELSNIDTMRVLSHGYGPGYSQFDWQFQKLFVDLALVIGQKVDFQNGANVIQNYLGIHNLNSPFWVDGVYGTVDNSTPTVQYLWEISDDPQKYDYNNVNYTRVGYYRPTWNWDFVDDTGSSQEGRNGFMSALIMSLGYDDAAPFFNYPSLVTKKPQSQGVERFNTYYCDEYFAKDWSWFDQTHLRTYPHPVFCEIGRKNPKAGLWLTDVAYFPKFQPVNGRLCFRPVVGYENPEVSERCAASITYGTGIGSSDILHITAVSGDLDFTFADTKFIIMARSLSPDHPDAIWCVEDSALEPGDSLDVILNPADPDDSELVPGVRYHILVVAQQKGKVNGPVAEIGGPNGSYVNWQYPTQSDGILSVYQAYDINQDDTTLHID